MNASSITRNDLVEYIDNNMPPLSRSYAFSNVLARYFNADTGEAVISERDLVDLLNCSPRSVSRMKSEVREAGYWEIRPGTWKKPTTYIPLFIADIKKEVASSD